MCDVYCEECEKRGFYGVEVVMLGNLYKVFKELLFERLVFGYGVSSIMYILEFV